MESAIANRARRHPPDSPTSGQVGPSDPLKVYGVVSWPYNKGWQGASTITPLGSGRVGKLRGRRRARGYLGAPIPSDTETRRHLALEIMVLSESVHHHEGRLTTQLTT